MNPYQIPNSSVVKATARAALRGRWVEAITVSSLGLFSVLIVSLLSSIVLSSNQQVLMYAANIMMPIISVFVLAPLFLGIIRFFWRLTDSAKDDISSAFYYFGSRKRYVRAIKLTFIIGWRVATAIILCMLPYFVTNILSSSWLYQTLGQDIPLWAANLILIESFLYIVGVICTILYISRYYLVAVVVVMDEELLLLEAVHISCMVSKRSSSSFLSLVASLLGWALLTFLLAPAIYTLPLMIACYVVHSRFAMTNYNLVLDYYENNMSGSYR